MTTAGHILTAFIASRGFSVSRNSQGKLDAFHEPPLALMRIQATGRHVVARPCCASCQQSVDLIAQSARSSFARGQYAASTQTLDSATVVELVECEGQN
jgi:hypothetical protein